MVLLSDNGDNGFCLIPGRARGDIVYTDVPLSFWMGIDPTSGTVIDRHHPLCGVSVKGKIFVLPGGRGSCSGSCGLVELIVAGQAPAALVLESVEPILTLGALIAGEIFGKSIPIASVGRSWFSRLASASALAIEGDRLAIEGEQSAELSLSAPSLGLALSDTDKMILDGMEGEARQSAMRIVQRFAEIVGARQLVDVEQAHIDCCFYTGPAGLAFAERLASLGAKVRVPTSTNATTVDGRRWRTLGIDSTIGAMSDRVAAAYVSMGAKASFTCAPYLLNSAPQRGQQVAWGESNAVAYANSVLGARTMNYPDFLDVCVALTGRAPLTATHTDEGRHATVRIDVAGLSNSDDALYPLLGYHIGSIAGHDIPAITGLEQADPDTDDLKAFSAAFATTSGSPMFHMVGVTPEAATLDSVVGGNSFVRRVSVTRDGLRHAWRELNVAENINVGLVSLGNPHFSLTEIAKTAALCRGRRKSAELRLIITCGRDVYSSAVEAGHISEIEAFGGEFLNDTCWCMVDAKQIASTTGALMTNSAKFAHYGPGITSRQFYFGSLQACIDTACTGAHCNSIPDWLRD